MKLKTFFASDGDCLLLTSRDGHHLLVDGGRSGTFQDETWPILEQMAAADETIDLVVVSHIDADHISGILWLLRAVAAWEVYDYQQSTGNAAFPEPSMARPPKIAKLWHNSWLDQLGEVAGPVESLATEVANLAAAAVADPSVDPFDGRPEVDVLRRIAESIPDGIELRRIVDDETPIPRNEPFRDFVRVRRPLHVEPLGSATLTVIGPATQHIDALKEEWKKWIEAQGDGHAVDQAARILTSSEAASVTPPNRASITLLAEEREGRRRSSTRSCLLTGDAAEDEILEGLDKAGRFDDGHAWCNVIKVQHHGSEFNLSQKFARSVLGEHYVFCADGAHENPDPSVVKTIVETRGTADDRPFTVWFNCSERRTRDSRRASLRAAIREATAGEDRHPHVSVRVLEDDASYLEIEV